MDIYLGSLEREYENAFCHLPAMKKVFKIYTCTHTACEWLRGKHILSKQYNKHLSTTTNQVTLVILWCYLKYHSIYILLFTLMYTLLLGWAIFFLIFFFKDALNWSNVAKKIVNYKCLYYLNVIILNSIDQWFSWVTKQHIIIISEGTCDTDDFSNDAENSGLPSIKILKNIL